MVCWIVGIFKHTQELTKGIICDVIPKEKQSEAFGRNNAISAMAFIIGPTIGGHILELDNGFYIMSMATVAMFVVNTGGSELRCMLSTLFNIFTTSTHICTGLVIVASSYLHLIGLWCN